MLIAGSHYAWNQGGLRDYEPTFLHHKVETMRLVNEWLTAPDTGAFNRCVQQVGTLCLTEVRPRISVVYCVPADLFCTGLLRKHQDGGSPSQWSRNFHGDAWTRLLQPEY